MTTGGAADAWGNRSVPEVGPLLAEATPTPWTVHQIGRLWEVRAPGRSRPIAVVEREADARLIANAPGYLTRFAEYAGALELAHRTDGGRPIRPRAGEFVDGSPRCLADGQLWPCLDERTRRAHLAGRPHAAGGPEPPAD